VGGVLGVSLIIIVVAWWLGRRRMGDAQSSALYYERMVRRGNWWGCEMEPTHTPNEYASKLSALINDEEADRLVNRITDAYVGERFGNKNPARFQPDFAWRDLRPTLSRWGVAHMWRRLWGA
jgi:hypothetical protein